MNKEKDSKIKEILSGFLNSGFFDGTGKTTLEVIRRLTQKGFTIKGKKIGAIATILTKMCQNPALYLEREEIAKEKRTKQERWIFKRVK